VAGAAALAALAGCSLAKYVFPGAHRQRRGGPPSAQARAQVGGV